MIEVSACGWTYSLSSTKTALSTLSRFGIKLALMLKVLSNDRSVAFQLNIGPC